MDISRPSISEIGFRCSSPELSTTAAVAESQKAWHIASIFLRLGRPARPDELASNCTLFDCAPDFICYLCSIPNSPIRLADTYVNFSQLGLATLAQFFNNTGIIATFLDPPRLLPRLLENVRSSDEVRTYYRKRKRFASESDCFPLMTKQRCCFRYLPEDMNLDQLVLTMGDDTFENIHSGAYVSGGSTSRSIATVSHVSSVLPFDFREQENVLAPPMLTNSSTHILESENVEYEYSEMKDKVLSNYVHQPRWQSNSLSHGRFQQFLEPILEENIMDLAPHSGSPLRVTSNSEVSKDVELDIVHPITNKNLQTTSLLGVDQQMSVLQAESETFSQSCGPLPFDLNEEALVDDCDRYTDHLENPPMGTTLTENLHTVNLENILGDTSNVVFLLDKPRSEVNQLSQGDTLKHSVKPSSVAIADQKELKNHGNTSICSAVDNGKYSTPKAVQKDSTHNRTKSNPVKLKTKSDYNQDMYTKGKKEKFMENQKGVPSISGNNDIEQKAFPDFESYTVEEEEGSGGYGTVYRARRKSDGVIFAIKCPHVNANRNHVHNELKMLQRLGGRNFVIKYESSFKSGNSDCLVLEHVKHDRPEVLKREINIFQLQWYGYCMFKALAGLHKLGIAHRDVKPGNFLFSRSAYKGYLIDFNLALDLHKKHGPTENSKTAQNVNFDHIPLYRTKSLQPAKDRKLTNTKSLEAVNYNAGKGSKSLLPPGNLKRKVNQAKGFTDTSSRNIIKSQGADVSGITSAKDATSTRTPSAERLREPIPSQGRKELINMVQEALQGGNQSLNAPTAKRKRVAAPPQDTDRKFFYPTPMPLHSSGVAIGGAGLLKSSGKPKREGPCVGTKGFRAPEVLFRSMHQGPKVDIWSAGVTLLYLMIGRSPFTGDPDQNIKEIAKLRGSEDLWEVAKLHNHESLFPTELFDAKHLSPVKLRDWCARNTRRSDFLEVIPRSLFDLVDKCLTVNPRLRISAEEALRHEFFAPCHEAIRKQRLQRQGLSLDSGTTLLLRGESQPFEVK